MTLQDNIKQLPLEDKAAILIELQDDDELIVYLKNEQWLQQQSSIRESKIINGEAQFTSREHLNKLLAEQHEF